MIKAKFAVVTDLHYFSPTLTDGGRAYDLRSGKDQKCLLETGAIIDAAFKQLAADDNIESVLIPGDLTCDGEKVAHLELIEKLKELKKHKNVYVTVATHDWCCDQNAKTYFGDETAPLTETASIDDLGELYYEFGRSQAIAEYKIFNGLYSYVVKLGEGVRLLALNDDQSGHNSSGFGEDHLEWIKEQMDEAKKAGDKLVAMQHHVVLKHYTDLLTSKGLCCGNREQVAEFLTENGVELLFVGHSHMQNITEYISQNGNKMVQMNLASLTGHPGAIAKVDIDDEYITVKTEQVGEFEYDGKTLNADYITEHSKSFVSNIVDSAAKGDYEEFSARLKALGLESGAVKRFLFIIKRLIKYINTVNVGAFAKKANHLTFGKAVDSKAAKEIADKKVIDLVYEIFLNLVDGGFHKYEKGSATYTVVTQVAALPSKIVSHLGFVPQKVKSLLEEISVLSGMLIADETDNNYIKYRHSQKHTAQAAQEVNV